MERVKIMEKNRRHNFPIILFDWSGTLANDLSSTYLINNTIFKIIRNKYQWELPEENFKSLSYATLGNFFDFLKYEGIELNDEEKKK